MTPRNIKLAAMFLPLLLFFIGFSLIVNDLRHPQVREEQCTVTAVGPDAIAFLKQSTVLYRQSNNPLHNVSLHCPTLGTLFLNNVQLMQTPIKKGQLADVKYKHFQFLPENWAVSVHTGLEKK